MRKATSDRSGEARRKDRRPQSETSRPLDTGAKPDAFHGGIGAITENPSFKVAAAFRSRCRTFTLAKLVAADVQRILARAFREEAVLGSARRSGCQLNYIVEQATWSVG